MQVEMRSVSAIQPYANNPRTNDHAVEAVAASIREFGFRQPIVVDEHSVILVGDTRYKAALWLGLETVPVHVAAGLTPAQVKAYRLADNKTAELADWDSERLVQELLELKHLDFDVDFLGFSSEELDALWNADGFEPLADPDAIPAPPDEPTTEPGDLWLLGEHRLLCGDAGSQQDVDRLLEGAEVHLVNCDPPYNVKVEPRSNNALAAGNSSFPGATKKRTHHQCFDVARQGEKKRTTDTLRAKDRPLINDFVSDAEFARLLKAWFSQISRMLLPGRSFYIWGGYANLGNYPPALKSCGLYFSQAIVWDKEHPVLTRKDMMGCFELAFYGWKEGAAHKFFGPPGARDLWSVKKVTPLSMIHLTEKPVALAGRALEYSSRRGENVLDLFAGSGSTLVACQQTGRRAFLMELDPLYVDVIVERWQRLTGGQATRQQGAG